MNTIKSTHVLLSLFFLGILLSSCHIYSFTGASISSDTKTVSIAYFENNAPLVVPNLSQNLTEALKDKVTTLGNLSLVRTNADLEFEGQITDYNTKPIAIQGDEVASQNRLTISVKINFINRKDEEKSFESVFTRYADYPGNKNLSEVENELIRQINSQLTEDIFNKAFINW